MRAYVNHCDHIDRELVVQFNASPDLWKMSRNEAAATRAILNAAIIRDESDPLHLCHFEVAEVGPEEFALFCDDHPDLQAMTPQQELKNRLYAFMKMQRDQPVTEAALMHEPGIGSAGLQVVRSALRELEAEGRVKGVPLFYAGKPEEEGGVQP